jgi:NADPH:quinone reductase-like Zn-dependent oxidoreductase
MSETVSFSEYGDIEGLEVGQAPSAAPGPGEVTIANRAISVNPLDWMVVAGYLKDMVPLQLPAVPGNESAGVVEAVGPGVTSVAVGDEVIWSGFGGGYRAEATVPEATLTLKPKTIDFEQAASLPIAAGTGYAAVEQIAVTSDDVVLIHGAAGGVGSVAVQLAVRRGATVIGTASEKNHDYLRSLGAQPVLYGDGLVDRVRAIGTVTASIDAFGGAGSIAATTALLADLSRSVTAVSDEASQRAGIPALIHPDDQLARVVELAAEGAFTIEVSERFALADARQALELSQGHHVRGKIVLIP